MLVLWLVFQKVALMCAAGKSMLRTRQAQRLANGGVVHRYQPVEFIDRPAFRRDVDEDGVFGGGFSGSESDEFDVDMDAGPEDAEDAPPASGIPFWPADEEGELILPDPDVDMFVFRKVFASDFGALFGQYALFRV